MPQTHVRHDFNETLHEFRDLTEVATLDTAFGALAEKGRAYLLAEGIKPDAIIFDQSDGFRNIPAEVYETKFPVRLEEFSIRKDSGGPRRYRGGCGAVRRYKTLEPCISALWFEWSHTPAWGLNGRQDGTGPFIEITLPDGTKEHLFKMRARGFEAGTVVETMTGGGGGNGNPKPRPFAEVLTDVRQGYLTRDAGWLQ